MKRILLINQGKTENLGDKAINIVFQELLREHGCIVDFAGFAQTNEQFIDQIKLDRRRDLRSYIKRLAPAILVWFFKYRKRIRKEFESIANKNYDLVVIGGGQLIKTKNVFVYTLLSWIEIINKNIRCPIILAGVGADKNYSTIEKSIYKKILPKIQEIYVRDRVSQQILKKQFNVNAKYMPDIVFAYSKFVPSTFEGIKKNKLLVMIYDYGALKKNFDTPFNDINSYFDYWKNLIEENIAEDLEVVLSYTTIGDKITTYEFANYLSENTHIEFSIQNTDRIDDLVNTLKHTKIVISGRMHGMLLALNYDCDIVPYVLSPKIKAFKNEWLDKDLDINNVRIEINRVIKDLLSTIEDEGVNYGR